MESGKHALQGTVVCNKIQTNINMIITKETSNIDTQSDL